MILKFSQWDVDIIVSVEQDKQFQQRWLSLHGAFPDDGNGHHQTRRNMEWLRENFKIIKCMVHIAGNLQTNT
jgi:hypothetical protein